MQSITFRFKQSSFIFSLLLFALILGIMVHVYMAIWVRGSITGMVEGWVTARWAKKHHPRWFRESILPELEKEEKEEQEQKK